MKITLVSNSSWIRCFCLLLNYKLESVLTLIFIIFSVLESLFALPCPHDVHLKLLCLCLFCNELFNFLSFPFIASADCFFNDYYYNRGVILT